MDLITFGAVALILAVLGLLASLIVGVRHALERTQERRYLERTARLARGRGSAIR